VSDVAFLEIIGISSHALGIIISKGELANTINSSSRIVVFTSTVSWNRQNPIRIRTNLVMERTDNVSSNHFSETKRG
jgi:hypothetical protein